jgi:heme/copper-type cytochrome/quinol oxidase subunit 3
MDVACAGARAGDGDVTAIELRSDHLLPPACRPHNDVGWWAMVLFLFNEAALFASLLASYLYLGLRSSAWPPPGVAKPALELPLIMTALLLSSSVALVVADRAFERGATTMHRAWTLVTVVLGASFLLIQAREYADKLKHGGPTGHAYESLFFTITGLHGAHVAFGLLLLLWALARAWSGTTTPRRPLAIKNASLYWHFVDGVWLVILTTLYLSPRWY